MPPADQIHQHMTISTVEPLTVGALVIIMYLLMVLSWYERLDCISIDKAKKGELLAGQKLLNDNFVAWGKVGSQHKFIESSIELWAEF